MIDTTRSTLNNGVLSGSESQIINHFEVGEEKTDVVYYHCWFVVVIDELIGPI